MKRYLFPVVIAMLSGCATYQPVPEGYTGPTAIVSDTGFREDGTTAQLFVLDKIDGNMIEESFGASAQASYGQGFALTTKYESRRVPARLMKVELFGGHTTAAPIQAIYKQIAGTFFTVRGEVDFNPKADRHYLVKGELKKEGSAIWIEDSETGEMATAIVTAK